MQDASAPVKNRVVGGYNAEDFADILRSEWRDGIPPGLSTGFPELDEFYRVKTKQWTVVSGMPGSGKSTVIDNILVKMAKEHNWKFLICSPENQPIQRHIENLIEIYTGRRFLSPDLNPYADGTLPFDSLVSATRFINDHFYFICPDEIDFHIEYILTLAEEIRTKDFDFKGFLIDPFNEMEHKIPAGFREDQYLSATLTKVRRYVRASDTHLWFVAHPKNQAPLTTTFNAEEDLAKKKLYRRTSLYDISGGAHWYNKCDNGIIIYRDQYNDTHFCVDKIRFRECGKHGTVKFNFDVKTNRITAQGENR